MEAGITRKILSVLCITHLLSPSTGMPKVGKYNSEKSYPVIRLPLKLPPLNSNHFAQSKIVFPFPEDVDTKNYLPNLGFLTDLAFLFMPRDLPASGFIRLSRDVFESDQCVQYVGCEMTKVAQKHRSLKWVRDFLEDFPFQGDVADRLREGTMDAISKINKRVENGTSNGNGTEIIKNENERTITIGKEEDNICTFSCHPITSLTRGLKILTLLHDLVRTVK